MKSVGCKSWYDMEELEVCGIVEILKHIPRLLKIRCDVIHKLILLKPDIFIGIDAPDFNIFIENHLKKCGIRTVHYVSPSIWAWRKKRIFKIKKSTDLILTLFPFEKKIYDRMSIPCSFVGHPTADLIPLKPNKNLERKKLGMKKNLFYLALLPGSRNNEIEILTPIFLQTVLLLKKKWPKLNFITSLTNKKNINIFCAIKKKIAPNLFIMIVNGFSQNVMMASDIALIASGTATLECMLAKCPMVVAYRINPLTFWLIKHMIHVNYISLPNLLSGYELVKEVLQNNCHPENLSKALDDLLKNKKKLYAMLNIFKKNHKKIKCNADKKAANAIFSLIYL